MTSRPAYTAADIEYVTANYRPLTALCAIWQVRETTVRSEMARDLMPAASYTLPDGRDFFPDDYFVFPLGVESFARRRHFIRQYRFACRQHDVEPAPGDAEDAWDGYISGLFGVCLRAVSPETIAAKACLIEKIETLLRRPQTNVPAWREPLLDAVNAIDALLRPFTGYDRLVAGRPLSRERYVDGVRSTYGLTGT